MAPVVRVFEERDQDAVTDLALRAWEPVFRSMQQRLGGELFAQVRPDWRANQQHVVETACRAADISVWVAEVEAAVAGFVAVQLDREASIGQIYLIAVDPACQRHGVGASLTSVALDWIHQSGMTVAMVKTGGDAGHAPARELYEQAGFTQLPAAHYFKKL